MTNQKKKPVLTNPVTIPAVVLHLLDVEGESYGQDLLEKIKARTGGRLVAGWGSIYPALYHLEEGGFIVACGESSGKTGRARKMYKITKDGRKRAAHNREIVAALFVA